MPSLQLSHEWPHQLQNVEVLGTIIELKHQYELGFSRSIDRQGRLNNRFLELKFKTSLENKQQLHPIDCFNNSFPKIQFGDNVSTVYINMKSAWRFRIVIQQVKYESSCTKVVKFHF